jgi:5'(3')-deoxyribonucleotidase
MNRIFIDMDGVIVDFYGYARKLDQPPDEIVKRPGAYLSMEPMPGAIDAVRALMAMGFEVWAATKPPTGIALAYYEKAAWVFEYLPELKRNLVITHDKGLLGDSGDYLIDDRPHKANCDKFTGTLIVFREGNRWPEILEYFKSIGSAQENLPTSVRLQRMRRSNGAT